MDIFKFAMQMELDGQRFYEQSAANSPVRELREVFLNLADEEKRHYRLFKKLSEGATAESARELVGGAMKTGRNVFVRLIESKESNSFGSQVSEVWKKAREIEEHSVKLYSEEASRTADSDRKALLGRIADEERSHVYLIDNVLAFLADPVSFAESQQFAAFKSWEGR